MPTKKAISTLVMQQFGVADGIAVLAALEIAARAWSDADTLLYGTQAKFVIEQLSKED